MFCTSSRPRDTSQSKLFEILNTRFAKSSSVSKFITMIYGEISSDGTFRFISAGHPRPLVFSAEYDRLVDIDPERMKNVLPIGVFPSEGDIDEPTAMSPLPRKKRFSVNEVNLMGRGDILLLQTDGLYEHADGDRPYASHPPRSGHPPGQTPGSERDRERHPRRHGALRAAAGRHEPGGHQTNVLTGSRCGRVTQVLRVPGQQSADRPTAAPLSNV